MLRLVSIGPRRRLTLSCSAGLFALIIGSGCGSGGGDSGTEAPQFLSPVGSSGQGTAGSGTAPVGATASGSGGSSNAPSNADGAGSGKGGSSASEGQGASSLDPRNEPTNAAGSGNAPAGNGMAQGTGGGGNAAGGAGNSMPGSAGAGAGGAPQMPSGAGPFTSVPVPGGASAAVVCPKGVAFGNPLQGMGAVQQVMAPQGSFFAFIEGPVWVASLGKLFFSDNASGPERIWQLQAPFTTPSVFMPNSGSNGLAIDTNDQLLLADQAGKRVTRVSTASAMVTGVVVPAGGYKPNDVLMRSDGNVYFTDPNTQLGLYRMSPGGQLSGPFTQNNVPNAPSAPNGVELSPDENTLYVGDVNQKFITKIALQADGSLDAASAVVFARTQGNTVDGMSVDCAGNLYAGTANGVEVYSPSGQLLGTVPTGESSNSTFGGADRKTLFVTSRAVLKFVTLAVPGLPD
jgi:gluconolactonase